MILECPACHARYLVQISLFASGGRQVRCARCRHQWVEALPTSIDVFVPLPPPPPVASIASELPKAPEIPPLSQFPKPPGLAPAQASPLSPSPPSAMPSAALMDGSTHASISNLPALVEVIDWRGSLIRFFKGINIFLKVAAVVCLVAALPIVERQQIAVMAPATRPIYEFFHLSLRRAGEGLVFDQVKSELKYDSGTMRLIVTGTIRNTTQDMQIIPPIRARAIGPDGHIIQSWWIPAPAATVGALGDAPFQTEVNASTANTIENVYLEFYAQDEKADVAR